MSAKLSRRDRAAMQLAYEWCRDLGGADPWDAGTMQIVMEEASSAMAWLHWMEPFRDRRDEINEEGTDRVPDYRWMNHETRVLRARLALLLRAILRADAGDFGAHELSAWVDAGGHMNLVRGGRRRITPLWQLAPATRST